MKFIELNSQRFIITRHINADKFKGLDMNKYHKAYNSELVIEHKSILYFVNWVKSVEFNETITKKSGKRIKPVAIEINEKIETTNE